MANLQFLVTESDDYYSQLLAAVRRAKYRVLIAAMAVRSSQLTAPILAEIAKVAKRGVQVHIIADPYGMTQFARDTHKPVSEFDSALQQTQEQLAAIRLNGGTIHWIGRIGFNPFKGRYHPKITVVDDIAFCFGGINFDGTDNTDYMLQTDNKAVAKQLWQLALDNTKSLPLGDRSARLDTQNILLFDAGTPGQSVIYERACRLTKDASKVLYVSAMCPTGPLAGLLKAARSSCYFSRPSHTTGLSRLAQIWDGWRAGVPNLYKGTGNIHAKFMLFEMPDNTRVVLSGSNNFSWRGIAFGTKEIALQSTDPQLWKALHDIVFKVATAD